MNATLTPHRSANIRLDHLTVSPLNVRRNGAKAADDLVPLIRAQGLLQPLIARNTEKDRFEVVGGSRRLKALQQIAREDGGEPPLVPCILIAPGDDAAAIEASLAENIARLPMDEIDQYTAFAALIRQGRNETDIADHFGVTPLTVRRRLALARLIPDIHRAYRAGNIDSDTLKLLTLASRERQKAYMVLLRDPEQGIPPRWQLKAWLLGGAEIDTRFALFDPDAYKGDITGDLFGEARYFADYEQFWQLQNGAIASLRDELAAKGWTGVHVIGPDQPFRPHEWQDATKAQGGHAVIEVRPNGQIEVHKGLLSADEARKVRRARTRAKASGTHDDSGESITEPADTEETPSASDRPELSAPLANYVDLVRLSTVKAALIKSPKVALRLMVAHLLASSRHIAVNAEPMTANSEAIAASIASLASEKLTLEFKAGIRDLLQLDPNDPIIARGHDHERLALLFTRLQSLSDGEVLKVLIEIMAETLALGSRIVDTLGALLAADCCDAWSPDDTFFDLVRDRELTGALLAEVIGEAAARSYLTDTGTKKKEIIRNALSGKNRQKVSGWQPRWLRFPQGQYLKRPLTARGSTSA